MKYLWVVYDCVGKYNCCMIMCVDDIEYGFGWLNLLCDDWIIILDIVLWFKGIVDIVGL